VTSALFGAILSTTLITAGAAAPALAAPSKERPMNVAARFAALSGEWADHCRKTSASSNLEDYLRHPSYRGLIDLGPAAVPLIMGRYASDEVCPWEFVLEGITGVRFIEDRGSIAWDEVTKKRLAWWEKEKAKKE
jgi:hypothetical protein